MNDGPANTKEYKRLGTKQQSLETRGIVSNSLKYVREQLGLLNGR